MHRKKAITWRGNSRLPDVVLNHCSSVDYTRKLTWSQKTHGVKDGKDIPKDSDGKLTRLQTAQRPHILNRRFILNVKQC